MSDAVPYFEIGAWSNFSFLEGASHAEELVRQAAAEKVELSADSLYRTLCRRGNPELRSATSLLKAMGMRLVLQPVTRHGTCVTPRAGRDERDSHG